MVPAYLLSMLAKQRLALQERFADKFGHNFLVWEPGSWSVPKDANATLQAVRRPGGAPGAPGHGDALSFGLPTGFGKPDTLKIGRDNTNDIVINDATVSRQQAILKAHPPADWSIEAAPTARAVMQVNGADLKPGKSVLLLTGTQVKLGDVTLTYYALPELLERLKSVKA